MSVARPAMVLQDGAFGDPPPPWADILGPFRQSIRTTAMSVGRIGVPGLPQLPYAGTGFMVAEDAVMTNCHVAMVFSRHGADGNWSFQQGLEANLDFVEDPDRRPADAASPRSVRIEGVIGIHPALDLALLRVSGRPGEAADDHVARSGTARGPQPVRARLPRAGLPQRCRDPALDLRGPVLRQAPPAGSGDGASGRRDHPDGALLERRRAGRRDVPRLPPRRRRTPVRASSTSTATKSSGSISPASTCSTTRRWRCGGSSTTRS